MPEVTESRPSKPPTENAVPSGPELPLDTEEADRAADGALGLKLGTTTRTEIDDYTRLIRGQVALFAAAVRDGGGVEARGSWLEADQLLGNGPADGCLVFAAWSYVRDLARLLRRLVAEHRKHLAGDGAALPVRTPMASLNRTAPDRQAPMVPVGPIAQGPAVPASDRNDP
ncbi:hypothetical protein [Streptomyces sp. V2I9]|uniref:hypothetical protein n=1 Tax=Streptomyces sp. V2I9 TaxID=3042304 RepID=UPI002784343C|nr:hypothetical protein [Streptomyces sp. V2I9]MDQ0986527.1 hypothetical protein [Streptomyces sp. V2I9]